MAQTTPGLGRALFELYRDEYARDYADAMHGSKVAHLFFNAPYDEQAWQAAYDLFIEKVDTPEKFMQWADALHRAELHSAPDEQDTPAHG